MTTVNHMRAHSTRLNTPPATQNGSGEWWEQMACRLEGSNNWTVETGNLSRRNIIALAVCLYRCPVRDMCLREHGQTPAHDITLIIGGRIYGAQYRPKGYREPNVNERERARLMAKNGVI